MAEQTITTIPAAPKPARGYSASDPIMSTREFLKPSDLYSVFISYAEPDSPLPETAPEQQQTGNSSRNDRASAARVELKRRKVLNLARTGREHYAMLKKYDGVVISRNGDSFIAKMFENPSDYPVIEAEFALDDVAEGEADLVVEGAQLVWTISYRYEGTTRFRHSMIYLRRSAWSQEDLTDALIRRSNLMNGIDWNESPSSDERD